jgi:hypothetical protein
MKLTHQKTIIYLYVLTVLMALASHYFSDKWCILLLLVTDVPVYAKFSSRVSLCDGIFILGN